MKLQAQLAKIQKELHVGKTRTTTHVAKYKYRNCEDILSAVKPLLGEAVLKISDQLKSINDQIYIESTAEISLGEELTKVTAQAFVDFSKRGMTKEQQTGSASSYARKYALSGLLLLDDAIDPDSQDNATQSDSVDSSTMSDADKALTDTLEDIL